MKLSSILPVLVVITIIFLTMIVTMSERSNDPGIRGDPAYPHYACQINRYCEGSDCSAAPISFVAYLRHENGQPRLELPRYNALATVTEVQNGYIFESEGGIVSGTVTIYKDRQLDIAATSEVDGSMVEHFASGSCDRLVEP